MMGDYNIDIHNQDFYAPTGEVFDIMYSGAFIPLVTGPIWVTATLAKLIMMTSSNGNILRVTGLFCGEFTDDRWIPFTKASDAEFLCFLWSAPE